MIKCEECGELSENSTVIERQPYQLKPTTVCLHCYESLGFSLGLNAKQKPEDKSKIYTDVVRKCPECERATFMYDSGSEGTMWYCVHTACAYTEKINILQAADYLTATDRRKEYGHPKENFKDTAAMWNVVLREKLNVTITPDEVVLMMICLKVCRGKQGYKRGTVSDIAGYARCWELIREEE